MARRQAKPAKTFQQRQTEKREAEARDRAVVEDIASKFTCSNEVALDFAEQCETRIDDLDFDLLCSELALEFWATPPPAAQLVVDLLHELADERRRHQAALSSLRERLRATINADVHSHTHLELPIEHYRQQVRQRLFPES